MILAEITACFPSISDWEDSYLADRGQRLLGNIPGFKAEIILGDKIRSIGIFFDNIDPKSLSEILSALNLITADVKESLDFLETGSAFVVGNPNMPYQRKYQDYSAKISRIQAIDAATYFLSIQANADLQ
jgi:hypothetical protein